MQEHWRTFHTFVIFELFFSTLLYFSCDSHLWGINLRCHGCKAKALLPVSSWCIAPGGFPVFSKKIDDFLHTPQTGHIFNKTWFRHKLGAQLQLNIFQFLCMIITKSTEKKTKVKFWKKSRRKLPFLAWKELEMVWRSFWLGNVMIFLSPLLKIDFPQFERSDRFRRILSQWENVCSNK